MMQLFFVIEDRNVKKGKKVRNLKIKKVICKKNRYIYSEEVKF